MASITITMWITIAAAIIGVLLLMWSTKQTFKQVCSEIGKALLWTGLGVTLLALSGKVLHC
jgi:ABC-type phosphate/phosphonate transport system permease subunit